MNAPLRNFDLAGAAPDRRREPRVGGPIELHVAAMLTMSGEAPCAAQVSDVSLYGCCVATLADCLRPGRLVTVTLESGRAWESIVRWTGNGVAGLEWLRPIPDRFARPD